MKKSHVNHFVKMKNDVGLVDNVKKLNTMPLHLGSFVLSNNKRVMNNFIPSFNELYTNNIYYGDTD